MNRHRKQQPVMPQHLEREQELEPELELEPQQNLYLDPQPKLQQLHPRPQQRRSKRQGAPKQTSLSTQQAASKAPLPLLRAVLLAL